MYLSSLALESSLTLLLPLVSHVVDDDKSNVVEYI